MPEERLQKILARAGIASRRKAEEFILAGRVTVDGRVAHLGEKADPGAQRVALDGKPVRAEPPAAYLVHKPKGVVVSSAEDETRTRVVDLVPDRRRLYAAGRLGIQDEGAILVTNDGALAELATHARYGLARVWHATVAGRAPRAKLERLEKGVTLDGKRAAVSRVRVKHGGPKRTILRVEVAPGASREVRRLLGAVGLSVTKLVRVAIGPLRLGTLATGAHRRLSPREIDALRRAAGRGASPRPRRKRRPRGRRR